MTIAVGTPVPIRRVHPWKLLKEGVAAFIDDSALTRGAAIAFYVVVAMGPVLFIATTVAGLFLGPAAASGAVNYQLHQVMSPASADMVQFAIGQLRGVHHTLAGSLIGFAALVITASGVFTEVQDALNVIWKAPRTESYLLQLVRGRIVSLALVVTLGVLLMISMIFASAIGVLGHYLGSNTGMRGAVIWIINFGLAFGLLSLLFAALYKVLPNTPLAWRDVMVGAMGTALLFLAGQALISFYLSRIVYANVYGAAAGIIILLVWVYYAAQVFLLGAEFTKVWAHHYGSQQTS